MQKKEFNELKSKTVDKLLVEVETKRLAIYKFRSELKAGKEKNLKKGKMLRKDLSQILTVIKEKQIEEKMESNKLRKEEK